jgi:uncharacterized membrane protein
MKVDRKLWNNTIPCAIFLILAVIFSSVFYEARLAAMCGYFTGYFSYELRFWLIGRKKG